MQNMSDYNALREQNIAKRNAIFAKFFNDVNKIKEEEETFQKVNNINENEPPKKRRRVSHNDKKDNTFRSSSRLEFHKEYNTRSRAKVGKNINTLNDSENSDNTSDDDSKNNETTKLVKKKKPNLRKVLPWAKHFQNGIADITKTEVNEEEEKESEGTTAKEYSSIYGTSCHQCRQKTMDTKTICRSGECFGKRGQFCGPCLQGRYGEDVVTSLKDPVKMGLSSLSRFM
ncbi:PREDICTED: cell division cycle-associated protein 7-like [Polistes dominula]|uniref:Cell division cycle-associated protein 7-like n=1 Tax=Polistes dominula TaxID=743375 RepID=A0ABM1IXM6_POLDO|nr:PREDICTED: cell division cycle-associated protein 7-like [Polistes dominula]